jgi:hypothetical protein
MPAPPPSARWFAALGRAHAALEDRHDRLDKRRLLNMPGNIGHVRQAAGGPERVKCQHYGIGRQCRVDLAMRDCRFDQCPDTAVDRAHACTRLVVLAHDSKEIRRPGL